VRVLQVTDLYRPFVGGLELAVEAMSTELARRGHAVEVATQAVSGSRTAGRPPGKTGAAAGAPPVHRLGGAAAVMARAGWAMGLHPPAPDPWVVGRLRSLVARFSPDVVHAHGWMAYSAVLATPPTSRLVVGLHDYGLVCAKKTLLKGAEPCPGPSPAACLRCAGAHYGAIRGAAMVAGLLASRRLHRKVDCFVANSAAVAAASFPALPAGSDLVVIPPPSPSEVAPGRPAFLPAADDFVLFAGALAPHKGLDVLLEAQRSGLLGDRPLVLLGTGHQGVPADLPPRTSVWIDVSHADVLAAMRAAAVVVSPSVWPEPFGLVVVEAMGQGTPVVASSVGGLAELVADGETGLLVPPGDPVALGAAVRQLVDDPAARRRMGEAARARAERYRVEKVVDELEALSTAASPRGRAGRGAGARRRRRSRPRSWPGGPSRRPPAPSGGGW
jgi:glycosyltransferase involved in cell wall biosynthesis